MIEKAIGQKIKKYRVGKGLTQEQLGERVELSTNYISAVERGLYSLSLDKLVEIINCLDCSADEIFADVINNGYKVKATILSEEIASLPHSEQSRIFEIIETLIKTAKRN